MFLGQAAHVEAINRAVRVTAQRQARLSAVDREGPLAEQRLGPGARPGFGGTGSATGDSHLSRKEGPRCHVVWTPSLASSVRSCRTPWSVTWRCSVIEHPILHIRVIGDRDGLVTRAAYDRRAERSPGRGIGNSRMSRALRHVRILSPAPPAQRAQRHGVPSVQPRSLGWPERRPPHRPGRPDDGHRLRM